MTLSEFKAWFEGFTESIDRAPTLKQWARIKERVGEIDGQAVTERIYVDRYWPVVRPYYGGPYWFSAPNFPYTVSNTCSGLKGNTTGQLAFNSHSAMHALGAAEAATVQ